MNRQAIFNRIAKHLLTQGRKSGHMDLDPYGGGETRIFRCQYRTYDPTAKRVLKCAIGCLIPFRNYRPEIEGTNIHGYSVLAAIPPSLGVYSRDDEDFLSGLQGIHDNQPVASWSTFLRAFAYQNGLDTAVLDA